MRNIVKDLRKRRKDRSRIVSDLYRLKRFQDPTTLPPRGIHETGRGEEALMNARLLVESVKDGMTPEEAVDSLDEFVSPIDYASGKIVKKLQEMFPESATTILLVLGTIALIMHTKVVISGLVEMAMSLVRFIRRRVTSRRQESSKVYADQLERLIEANKNKFDPEVYALLKSIARKIKVYGVTRPSALSNDMERLIRLTPPDRQADLFNIWFKIKTNKPINATDVATLTSIFTKRGPA